MVSSASWSIERNQLLHVEMNPGDAIFFHGNLLHRSDQNVSNDPRWSLICCYNTKQNDPYKESRHPNYIPLELIDDESFESKAEVHIEHLGA